MKTLYRIWNILGSMRLAKWLLLCSAVLLFAGSICYSRTPEVFVSLNSALLPDWLGTFGSENIGSTWWFFLLLCALFLLGLNTGICTIERMVRIIRLRNRRSVKTVLFLLAPHIMHFAFLIIMAGYLVLYTSGINSCNNILKPGITRRLPGSSIMLELRDPSFFTARNHLNESLDGLYVNARYTLLFRDGDKIDTRIIGLNRPCIYKGYSIHVVDFHPLQAKSMTDGVWIRLTIIKNMGIPLFIGGVIIFFFGVVIYTLATFAGRH